MQPESVSPDIDLTPFWTAYDQIDQEHVALSEVQAAEAFWTGFADGLVRTRDAMDRAGKGMQADGAFGGLAAQRFNSRRDAGISSIEPWLVQDIRSVGRQFRVVEDTVNPAFGTAQQWKQVLAGLGVRDHQMRVHESGWTRSDEHNQIVDALELVQARRDDVRAAFKDLKLRREAISETEWSGFGSQSAGQLSGTEYEQGVTVLADPLTRHANEFTQEGAKPDASGATTFFAYSLTGPLGAVADAPSVLKSSAAVRFQRQMQDGMTLASTTLSDVVAKFLGHDHRTYLEIMQGLG
jgi:hypothetical protein